MSELNLRQIFLEVIAELEQRYKGSLQSTSVLDEVSRRVGQDANQLANQQALLTAFGDLFRTGYLAWGYNLSNPNPPWFHVTKTGRRALQDYSRDPANPDGYLAHLARVANLNPIAASYIHEAVFCYANDLPKAAAVMIGACSESIVLELRDEIVSRLNALTRSLPRQLNDWRIKVVVDSLSKILETQKSAMRRQLAESVEAYWPAYIQQIRASRNDAGHPSSIDPVTLETVHASLLILPELAKLAGELREWSKTGLK